MSQSKKPWVLVHYREDPERVDPPGLGLNGVKGFAVFPRENWINFLNDLPDHAFFARTGLVMKEFRNKKGYRRHLHVVYLSEFQFRQICKAVLNISPGFLQVYAGQTQEHDRRAVAKYGIFPEYEFPNS